MYMYVQVFWGEGGGGGVLDGVCCVKLFSVL